jgi:SAM-dependent MidA family methyltransferase
MPETSSLEAEIRRRIVAAGPMPVDEYMALCLSDREHGYYMTRDPLGARGDFITAPEVSQMFGELIGLWMAAVWKRMGEPESIRVIELGPGRGTMMSDALRASKVMPAFREAVVLHLIEISPVLQGQQEAVLQDLPVPMFWHVALKDVPAGPAIIVANEFFDALPVNQAVRTERGWHQRLIGIDDQDRLAFTVAPEPMPHFERVLPAEIRAAAPSSIYEWRTDTVAMEMGRRLSRDGGAALVIDYGHAKSTVGETLQAVGAHAYADPLTAPGTVDLTAHVDFATLALMVESIGAASFGPLAQGEFLRRLSIETRAATLKTKATEARAAEIDAALVRLTGTRPADMGALFKAAAYAHPKLGTPPGFDG